MCLVRVILVNELWNFNDIERIPIRKWNKNYPDLGFQHVLHS